MTIRELTQEINEYIKNGLLSEDSEVFVELWHNSTIEMFNLREFTLERRRMELHIIPDEVY